MRDYRLIHAAAFKVRGLAMVPVALLLGLCRWHETENELAVWGVGLPIFAAGVVLRIWAQRHLCYRLKAERRLSVTGPYAHVRNPVYIGNTLILVGLAMTCELFWMALPTVLWAGLMYSLAIRFEENRLAKRHGDEYRRYQERVPRWVPRLPTLILPWADCARAVSWSAAGRAEWHCPMFLLLPIVKEIVGHGAA